MADDVAIKVDGVSKTFRLPHEKNTSFKGAFLNFYKGKRTFEKQQALKDISFEIKKGEFFGIVGRNGSGKSTLLKILAGIYSPSKGSVTVNGKLTPFIELGVGFNPELTGRENVFLNGALLGFSRPEMQAMYKDIVEFAELEKFMDQKLKNYSSGMQVRLAFSIAIRAQSDILLVDEVLAVGDSNFQEKCFDVFRAMKKEGRTVVFVSHDLASLQEFCTRAVLIDQSEQRSIGDIDTIVMEYQTRMAQSEGKEDVGLHGGRPGSGKYRIERVVVEDASGTKVNSIKDGEPFSIRITYKQHEKIDQLVCGISISDASGISILGPNTTESKFKITQKDLEQANCIRAVFDTNVLAPGTYKVTVGIFADNGSKPYDFYQEAATFKIIGKARHGKITTQPKWSLGRTTG